jgi:penicillin-binding protein 1A
MQHHAEECFTTQIKRLRTTKKMPFDGGLITLDLITGGIKTYVGGFDFSQSQFDRVQNAERQLGSIFKVIVYAAAISAGKEFSDVMIDEPLTVTYDNKTWSPRNYTRDFRGQMTLAYALSRSNNIIAVKTLLEIGITPVIELTRKTHIKEKIPPYPALALGCIDVSLLNATAMFSIFATQGIYRKPHIILKIKDKFGNIHWKKPINADEIILNSTISGKVARVLQHSMHRYAKYFTDYTLNVDIIAKTGTTNDSRTCWFIGASPTYVTGVYVGCDDNRALGTNVFPIHTAFPIWLASMSGWHHRYTNFVYNPLLQEICIDVKTGVTCAHDTKNSMTILV